MPTLTVLICTHNRAELLSRVLTSLNEANKPDRWAVDLLVAANACTDGTHVLLDNYRDAQDDGAAIPLEWFAEPVPGKSHALNSAILRLKGDAVAFVDDDHRVDADFLANICRAVDAYPDATMFCGRILPDWDGSEPEWVHDEGPYKIYPLPVPRQDLGPLPRPVTVTSGPLPGGGNLVLRTDALKRVEGFSTELGPKGHDLGGGEDIAFVMKALDSGERLQYTPDVLQYHYVDLDRLRLPYLLRKAYQRSHSLSRVHHATSTVPLYMWRKLAGYSLRSVLPVNWPHTRFYLMRLASAMGEMRGMRDAAKSMLSSRKPRAERPTRRVAMPLLFGLLSLVGLVFLGLSLDGEVLRQAIMTTLAVTTLTTSALGIKSLVNFSQTGPQIRQEILAHYRVYSLYAFLRLLGYAFVILLIQVVAGGTLYAAAAYTLRCPYHPLAHGLAGIAGIGLITGLQFCRHLLFLPASLVASSHYRISRLYPLWRVLSPGRLKLASALLTGTAILLMAASASRFVQESAYAGLAGIFAASGAAVVLFLWLRPQRHPKPRRAPSATGPLNVLMIGSDTLRADRISPTLTPYLDGLITKGGHFFSHCYVPCARTAPSLISLMTGTWPHRHGVRDNFVADSQVRLQVADLPTLLRDAGYRTAALSDWCGADMGKFTFGFDYLDLPEDQWNLKYLIRQGPKDLRLFLSLFTHNAFGKGFLPELYYLGGVPLTNELGSEARCLINRFAQEGKPFLLNAFFSTTHPPFGSEYPYYTRYSNPDYVGESKFAMARLTDPWEIIRRQAEPREAFDLDQIIHLYDGCVRRFDDEVARIMEHLQACGLADNTLVVIYSDHGMEFFEHETWGQGNSALGDYSPRVPLILLDPRSKTGRKVDEVVRSIDVVPTLLDLLGLTPPADLDGVSLAGCLRDPAHCPELTAYNETGIWLTDLPGMRADHLRYPNLLELLEVPDKAIGTLAIKPEFQQVVVASKDRMMRRGRWKILYQPLEEDRVLWQLFDVIEDPECSEDVSALYPHIAERLRSELRVFLDQDLASNSRMT